MSVQVTSVKGDFVARISGVDLGGPLDQRIFDNIEAAFEAHGVAIFPDQDITDDQQIAFSERFGDLEPSVRRHRERSVSNPYISDISNIGPDGNLLPENAEAMSYNRGNQLWHSDSSFKRTPSKASLLSAREVPPDAGETEFCDMRAAWDALAPYMQARLDGLVAEHSLAYSRASMGYDAGETFFDIEKADVPPVPQTLARISPVNGRKSLYVGSHAAYIRDMDRGEGRALLDELLAHAANDKFVYVHKWSVGDLVMWDNRCVNHRGRPWDSQRYRRVMRRTTVAGDAPTV